MGQLQASVKSNCCLSHTVTKAMSFPESVIQGTDYHCSVSTGPRQKSWEQIVSAKMQRTKLSLILDFKTCLLEYSV